MSDAQSLTLSSPEDRPRFKRPRVPQPGLWWLWLFGCIVHAESAVTEFLAGRIAAAGKDTVLSAFWWLGLHAWRAGDRHRARILIFMIFAFDVSQDLVGLITGHYLQAAQRLALLGGKQLLVVAGERKPVPHELYGNERELQLLVLIVVDPEASPLAVQEPQRKTEAMIEGGQIPHITRPEPT